MTIDIVQLPNCRNWIYLLIARNALPNLSLWAKPFLVESRVSGSFPSIKAVKMKVPLSRVMVKYEEILPLEVCCCRSRIFALSWGYLSVKTELRRPLREALLPAKWTMTSLRWSKSRVFLKLSIKIVLLFCIKSLTKGE